MTYRPKRVVSLLNGLVLIAYVAVWIAAIVVAIVAPAARLWAQNHSSWIWNLEVPATLHGSEARVVTSWGAARLVVQHARGDLVLPLASVPWGLFAVLWMHAVLGLCMLLGFLYHLRRICQRVRDGSPFDVQNAVHMRWLGLLFFGLTLFNTLAEFITSMAVRNGVVGSTLTIAGAPHLEWGNVFIALVVVVLAEIFRRGAELEHEQSLVI